MGLGAHGDGAVVRTRVSSLSLQPEPQVRLHTTWKKTATIHASRLRLE